MSDLQRKHQQAIHEHGEKLKALREEIKFLIGDAQIYKLDLYSKPENIFKAILQSTVNPITVNNLISRKCQILNLFRDYQALAKQ